VNALRIEVWLYGELSKYANEDGKESAFAHRFLDVPQGSTIGDLLQELGMPSEARGLTFVNGAISSMPGLYPDLNHKLSENDRVGIFPPVSMLPFHYREGAPVVKEMADAITKLGTQGFAHDYRVHRDR
jgi:molybdopterin converting factor small subunit